MLVYVFCLHDDDVMNVVQIVSNGEKITKVFILQRIECFIALR